MSAAASLSAAVPREPRPGLSLAAVQAEFDPVPGYLNAATLGLPTRSGLAAVRAALDDWQAGRSAASGFDAAVSAGRAAYARLVGVPVEQVAIGSQASALIGLVAAAVPDGAEVLTVDGDFASVVFPFQVHADRGVRVRHVPLEQLAEQIRPETAVVAFSLVQSADGRVADAAAIRATASAVGALTCCDLTQAAGWLPTRGTDFDVTVCSTYKWLATPRGTAMLTVGARARDRLRPLNANWYAGEIPWQSVYGPQMRLADSARRFDVSPIWFAWVGAAPALDLFAAADLDQVHRHDVGLADLVRAGLGLPPGGSAVLALPDPDQRLQRALATAGCTVAARAGGVRIAFHVWNDAEDAARVLAAVRAAR